MSEFKTWEELSELEQAECIYSDMHKDAYGVRPRGIDTSQWTLEDYQQEFARLEAVIQQEDINRKKQEAIAIERFELRVDAVIRMGAKDRENALDWIMEADSASGDWEYLCFLNGLPYNYFREV